MTSLSLVVNLRRWVNSCNGLRTPGSTCSRSKKDFSAGKRGFLFSTPPWILDPSDGGRGQRVWEWDRPLPACGFKCSNAGNIGQRREGAISGYGSSEFLESLTGPSPTLVLPNNTGESIGARGVFPGPKASTHTLVPREGGYSGPWESLSSRDPGLAPAPVCLSDWGDPSELVTPPALPPSDRCLRQASQGLGQWQRGLHTAE